MRCALFCLVPRLTGCADWPHLRPRSPRGTKRGDSGASGVINSNFTLETARSTLFDTIFIPDGDELFVKELSSGRGLHWIREACVVLSRFRSPRQAGDRLTSPCVRPSRFAHYKTIAAIGASVPVFAHKAVPGNTSYKADLSAAYSSKNGVVLAENLPSGESSLWAKVTGVADLGGFGKEYIDAVSKHRHWDRDVEGVAF